MTKEELIEKGKEFDREIAELEKKHSGYFSNRKDTISDHILARHELFGGAADNHMLTWKKDTDLNFDIRLEAENLFRSIYTS